MAKHAGPNLKAPRLNYLILGLLFERFVHIQRKGHTGFVKGRIFEVRRESLVMDIAKPIEIPLEDIEEIRVASKENRITIQFAGWNAQPIEPTEDESQDD